MICHFSDALEGTAIPFAGKDLSSQSSPMSDRKKNRRKKSMNQKGDAAVGQAEGNCSNINLFGLSNTLYSNETSNKVPKWTLYLAVTVWLMMNNSSVFSFCFYCKMFSQTVLPPCNTCSCISLFLFSLPYFCLSLALQPNAKCGN